MLFRYLHSIMLLLYRTDQHRRRSFVLRFTFHYASTLSIWKTSGGFFLLFTFHYASTLSFAITPPPKPTHRFTFHYASTLSIWISRPAQSHPNLHSIMLLLYLDHGLCHLHSLFIYIPLCFYFIEEKGKTRWMSENFIYIPLCFYFI